MEIIEKYIPKLFAILPAVPRHYEQYTVFGPYRSHFLSRKSLIAAKNETKEERRKIGERDTTSACE
jgi:hypothetical protein